MESQKSADQRRLQVPEEGRRLLTDSAQQQQAVEVVPLQEPVHVLKEEPLTKPAELSCSAVLPRQNGTPQSRYHWARIKRHKLQLLAVSATTTEMCDALRAARLLTYRGGVVDADGVLQSQTLRQLHVTEPLQTSELEERGHGPQLANQQTTC